MPRSEPKDELYILTNNLRWNANDLPAISRNIARDRALDRGPPVPVPGLLARYCASTYPIHIPLSVYMIFAAATYGVGFACVHGPHSAIECLGEPRGSRCVTVTRARGARVLYLLILMFGTAGRGVSKRQGRISKWALNSRRGRCDNLEPDSMRFPQAQHLGCSYVNVWCFVAEI